MDEIKKIDAFDVRVLGSGQKNALLEYATEFASKHKYIRYREDTRSFFVYKDGLLKPASEHDIMFMLISDDDNDVLKRVKNLSRSKRKEVYFNLQDLRKTDPSLFNQEHLINFRNCYFDTRTNETIPHTGEILSTIQLPYNYDPESSCPLWEQTLNEIFEDSEEKFKLLQEFMGYCLVKNNKYKKALFLEGESNSGKSTILNVIRTFLGKENISSLSLSNFNNTTQLAAILNKYANIDAEVSQTPGPYLESFKKVTGGDTINFDEKYLPPYDATPFAKLIFACNRMPIIPDRSNAMINRLLLIECNRIFEDHEQDRTLPRRLTEEAAGIFNWALRGLDRLESQDRFTESSEMAMYKNDLQEESNPVKTFLDIYVEAKTQGGDEYYIGRNHLYRLYEQWMIDNKMEKRVINVANFSKEVRHRYKNMLHSDRYDSKVQISDTERDRVWWNLRLKELWETKGEVLKWSE